MPLDDAIGGRVGRETLGKCATQLRRLDFRTGRWSGMSGHYGRRRRSPISAQLVLGCAVAGACCSLIASAFAVVLMCGLAGVACAPGIWVMASLAAIGTALVRLRRSQVFSLAALRQKRLLFARTMLANILAGTAGSASLALMAPGTLAWLVWLPLWLCVTGAACGLGVVVTARSLRRLFASGSLARNVAVVGGGAVADGVVRRLCAQPRALINYVGTFDDGDVEDLLAGHDGGARIDKIVVCMESDRPERVARLRARLRPLNCDIYVAGAFLEQSWAAGLLERLGDLRVSKIERRPLDDWQLLQKAVLDRLGAAVLLVGLSPLLLLIALAIRIDSKGPVLFRQPRIGLLNRPFTMFKFRTMYHHHADLHGGLQTIRNDPRITRLGRFLRRTSLDELPQLLNVLGGDMSLVGPRPHAAATKAGGRLFQDAVADYPLRHRVKPGMTGWAQVNGWRGETSTVDQIAQRVAHDLHYIDHWSFLFDVRIMVLTLVRELNSKTAF